MIEIMPCVFLRHMKHICLVSEQSIAAIMYDGGWARFGIYKIVLLVDFTVSF